MSTGRAVIVWLVMVGVVVAGGLATRGSWMGCPAALLEGVLVEQDGTLVVEHSDGFVEPVEWARAGLVVRDREGELVLVDRFSRITAREGDAIRLGGGEYQTGLWRICGLFEIRPAAPS